MIFEASSTLGRSSDVDPRLPRTQAVPETVSPMPAPSVHYGDAAIVSFAEVITHRSAVYTVTEGLMDEAEARLGQPCLSPAAETS